MSRAARVEDPLSDAEYSVLARFRTALRVFLLFSEDAARGAGVVSGAWRKVIQVIEFPERGSVARVGAGVIRSGVAARPWRAFATFASSKPNNLVARNWKKPRSAASSTRSKSSSWPAKKRPGLSSCEPTLGAAVTASHCSIMLPSG